MTPVELLRTDDPPQRIYGDDASEAPLRIEEGECVGVVLFNLGGPESLDEVESFLYHLLMDPAVVELPVPGRLRRWLAKSIAHMRARTLRTRYEMIGGGSPVARLTREQAGALEGHLNDQYGEGAGVTFRTYPAMRYGPPSPEAVASEMAADDVDKVVLLPGYPQFSTVTTGSALAYWDALADAGERPTWPTTVIPEYAANPKYVQAVSERIDEGLQRFPRDVRNEVTLVFSAHDTVLPSHGRREDSYCCQVHTTVEQVMRHRDQDRPFRTAFQSLVGPSEWVTPSTPAVLNRLADQGCRSVLVVPVSFVTDHVNTSYELDVDVRAEAEVQGIDHFEVTAGLNTHPLFIEALAEATLAQLALPVDVNQMRHGGNGHTQTYPLRPLFQLPRHQVGDKTTGCPECGGTTGARRWTRPEQSSQTDRPAERPAARSEGANAPTPEPPSREES